MKHRILASFASIFALTLVAASFAIGPLAQADNADLSADQAASADVVRETASEKPESISAINRALDEALKERAKSQTEFERTADRAAARAEVRERDTKASFGPDIDARENRAQLMRESRDEVRREKRLNWLND